MRIVIDLQGAQSNGSRNRGIGRYSLALAQAIVRQRGEHEILIALSGIFADSIAPIRAAFDGLLAPEQLRVWEAPPPVAHLEPANDFRRRSAELLREAFLASLQPDLVLVSSLFEGLDDDAVTSVGELSGALPTAVILYDLIPLIQRELYLTSPVVERWYQSKLAQLRRADLLLAISESSRREGIAHLGFGADDCVSISTAADPHFQPRQVEPAAAAALRARHGLTRPFLMYTGGIDHRKNIEGLIAAYALLPAALRGAHQLAIVCSIKPHNRHQLEQLARRHRLADDELVLTGFVSDDDLVTLYNLCKAFVFPSWHEGFGLPALEAMSCGRAVVAANTTSLPEVVGLAEAMFDPRDPAAIAAKLAEVLGDDAFRARLERHGLVQARQFSWDASARRALAAAEAWQARRPAPAAPPAPPRRPRLAFLSPLPPARSGIADYSAELLPELARHYAIDVVAPQDELADPWVKANCVLRSVDWFAANAARYDRVLYHFGNSHVHQHMFALLEQVPGVVVLHDFYLSGIAAHMDATGYRSRFWADSLYRSHGYGALAERYAAADSAEVVYRYPCNLEVLRGALATIVHSGHSQRLARQWYGEEGAAAMREIALLRAPAAAIGRADARAALAIGADDFLVCSFGLLGPTKLNHRLLDAWLASSLAADPRAVLVFVGENQHGEYGAALKDRIARHRAGARIRITGWAEMDTFRRYLAAADGAVQLRTLSRGETSATVLDCMNYGLPTIVNANGSNADLADDGVLKLDDEFDDAALVAALERMAGDAPWRAALGARGRAIVAAAHAPRRCADQYAEVIEQAYRANAHRAPALTAALVDCATESPGEAALAALAQSLSRSIAPPIAGRQLLVDVSHLGEGRAGETMDLGAHGDLLALLKRPPEGVRIEPVAADGADSFRYARQFTLRLLGCPASALADEPVEPRAGDLLLAGAAAADAQAPHRQRLRDAGVRIELLA